MLAPGAAVSQCERAAAATPFQRRAAARNAGQVARVGDGARLCRRERDLGRADAVAVRLALPLLLCSQWGADTRAISGQRSRCYRCGAAAAGAVCAWQDKHAAERAPSVSRDEGLTSA